MNYIRNRFLLVFCVVLSYGVGSFDAKASNDGMVGLEEAPKIAEKALEKVLGKNEIAKSQIELQRTIVYESALIKDPDRNCFPYVSIFESKDEPKETIEVYVRHDKSYEIARWRGRRPIETSISKEKKCSFKADDLVGTWAATKGNRENIITFHADGTYTGRMLEDGEVGDEYTGDWGLIGDQLQYCYKECKALKDGERDVDWILDLNADRFILRTTGAEKRVYRKVN